MVIGEETGSIYREKSRGSIWPLDVAERDVSERMVEEACDGGHMQSHKEWRLRP